MNKEIWLPVKGFEGSYKVSNLGRVLSRGGCIRVPTKSKLGYMRMNLSVKGLARTLSVHRMVATAFINNPEFKKEVNHIDGDKTNNKVGNLEWCTSSENKYHAIRTGLLPIKSGASSARAKLSDIEVDFLRYFVDKGFTQAEVADTFGLSKSVTSNIVNFVTYKKKQSLLMNA